MEIPQRDIHSKWYGREYIRTQKAQNNKQDDKRVRTYFMEITNIWNKLDNFTLNSGLTTAVKKLEEGKLNLVFFNFYKS